MSNIINQPLEEGLIDLVNNQIHKSGVELDEYQVIDIYINSQQILRTILDKLKFEDIGNIYDYPEILPQSNDIDGYDLICDYDLFQRIAISKKYNSIIFYSVEAYCIRCGFIIDTRKIKKFSKKIKDIIKQDTGANLFGDENFKCKDSEYIEIVNSADLSKKTKPIEVLKKRVKDEKLVFDKKSTISEVMDDISSFFKKKTEALYSKLEIPYKRGIILYGDPGNGKSAMIREVIRTLKDVPKIIVNCDANSFIRVMKSLIVALNGAQAIIIIEDIDSMISQYNKSAFLNLLDGVDVISGVYLIGTTNYPERIDPAFMNRAGRFDRMFEINNPSRRMRRLYFESKKVGKILSEYKETDMSNKKIVDLFVAYSANLSMSSLKELITTTSYKLISDDRLSIENAIKSSYEILKTNKEKHADAVRSYNDMQDNFNPYRHNRYDFF